MISIGGQRLRTASANLKSVDRTQWHLDIRDNDADIGAGFKDCDCLICICGFNSLHACVFDEIDCRHTKDSLIVDHEDNGLRHGRS